MKSALIIEDDAGVVQSLNTVLIGYAKRSVTTMSGAIKVLKAHEFDVVFLDLGLPDSAPERTLEMIPMLRMLAKGSALIMMTGFHSKIGNAQNAVDSILLKPFHSGHIRQALEDADLSLTRNRCLDAGNTVNMCRAILAFQ